MATTTTTQTFTINIPPSPLLAWVISMKELPKIRDTYDAAHKLGLWKDPLSDRLFKWIDNTWSTACTYNSTVAGIEAIASKAIENLKSNVSYNEFDGAPLREPKLDRKWTWENDDLQLYLQNIGSDSPYDGEKMQITDHLFAQAVLQWTQSVPLSTSLSGSSLVVAPATEAEKAIKLYAWTEMIKNVRSCKALDKMTAAFEDLSAKNTATTAAVKATLADEVIAVKQRDEDRIVATETRIDTIDKQHQSARTFILEQLSEVNQELHQTTQALAKEGEKNAENTDKIETLEARIRDLESQIAYLISQLDDDDSCSLL